MFTPVGLLRDITCPYFQQDGKCDRPHCVFGHGASSGSAIRRPPSPLIASAYDYASKPAEEYDPAANFDMAALRRCTTPTAYDPAVSFNQPVRENIIMPVAVSRPVSNQSAVASSSSKPVAKVKHSVTFAPTSSTTASNLTAVSRDKRPLPNVQETTNMKKNKTVMPPIPSRKIAPTTLPLNKTAAASSSTIGQISAVQILDKLSSLPKKISPFLDDDDDAETGEDSSKQKKSQDVIDLTDDFDKPVAKRPAKTVTSSLVEAAAARCKRKLLSPAEACAARIRECEEAGIQRPSTSTAQQFQPQTSAEGGRVAHAPRSINTAAVRGKPRIPIEYNAKVPTMMRQQFLDKLVDELLKTGKEHEWCFGEAVRIEKEAYGRSSTDKVYKQVIPNVMMSVRREHGSAICKISPTKLAAVSHTAMLMPPGADKVGVGTKAATSPVLKGPITATFTKSQLYRLLSKYVLTEEQLKSNGYPVFVSNEDGSTTISIKPPDKRVTQRQSSLSNAQLAAGERECTRCQKVFRIHPVTGAFIKREECQYHSGRVQKVRTHARNVEQVYSCCQASTSSIVGCQLGATHVHEHNRTTDLEGYVSTKDDSNTPGIFAIDCEMVYTLKGVELARVTVIDHKLETVFDALVRPETEVLDYNTNFSGLKKCDFDHVTDRLANVQRKLCSMINARSIIVGHSLESDLIALKLVHRTVVDTAIVFPHPQGPPYKRALRTLVADILRKAIQQGIGGHDSTEDAASAMELMLFKAKSDHQTATATSISAVADRSSAHRRNSFPKPLPDKK